MSFVHLIQAIIKKSPKRVDSDCVSFGVLNFSYYDAIAYQRQNCRYKL